MIRCPDCGVRYQPGHHPMNVPYLPRWQRWWNRLIDWIVR